MKLLAIDTATEACSVALQIDDQVISRFEVCPQQHSQRLLPMVDEVLSEAQLNARELDHLAFGRGPGSFTGVRIATGMLQGLALGTGLQVVGISTLAAMAQQVVAESKADNIAVAIDARMDEVYFSCFRNHHGLAEEVVDEQVCAPEFAMDILPFDEYTTAGTGWEAYQPLTKAGGMKHSSTILYPNAKYMLPLATEQIKLGNLQDIDDIQPVYLRDKVTWKKLPGR